MLKEPAPTVKSGYYLTQSLARGITGRDLALQFHTLVEIDLYIQDSCFTAEGVVFSLVCLTTNGKKSYYI